MLKGKGQIDTRIPFGPYVVESFGKKSPAKTAGILVNDQVVGLDDKKFTYYDEFQKYLFKNKQHPVTLNIIRKGQNVNVTVSPDTLGMLGIGRSVSLDQIFELKTIKYGFFQSVPAGINKGFKTITDYLETIQTHFFKTYKSLPVFGWFYNNR